MKNFNIKVVCYSITSNSYETDQPLHYTLFVTTNECEFNPDSVSLGRIAVIS